MNADSDQRASGEVHALRRCLRDLTALSTLSAVWHRSDLRAIAEGLCRVVCVSLRLPFVYVRVSGLRGAIEIAATQQGPVADDATKAIGVHLAPLLHSHTAGDVPVIPDPCGSGTLRLAITPLGHESECGVLVAGSQQADFPQQTDSLLLGVAANQAAIVLQQKRSEDQVRESEKELADFFDSATLGLHWVGPDGTVMRVNRAELQLLGYSHDEYVGRHIAEFHADRHVIEDILRRLASGEALNEYPARLRCKDGSIRHVLIDSSVLWDEGKFVHTRCFTRDVTEQRLAEHSLHRQTERLRLLWEAAALLLTADNPDTMLGELLSRIGPHLGVDTYFSFAVSESGDALRLLSCQGIPAEAAREIARLEFGKAICGAVASQRRAMVVANIQTSDEPSVQPVRSFGLRAYACSPLIAGDRLLGTLSFASRTKDRFDSDEVAFMETICQYVTVAHERLRLLDELKDADRRKDEFLATLAHELRNPLAPARNAVQLLRLKGPDEPELRWARDVIDRQIDHLTRLIDDLMDVGRITRNKLELHKQRVDLAEVIRGAVESSRPAIEQRAHELTVTLPAEPVHLDADLVRLAQVFVNLLNNAAKYMERGGRIWLTAEQRGNFVEVRVKDAGVGIPAEKLPRLFELFFQVDGSLERSEGGLGIGLSLVRRLVELHSGTVEGRSDGVGQGSEFIVRLPLPVEEASAPVTQQSAANAPVKAAVRRILVVDDNRDAADSLAVLLRTSGHDVHTAYDGAEAIQAADRLSPDVVLLDIGMPKVNGYDVCRHLREGKGGTVLLVAMTGWGQEEHRRRTMEAGFDAHVVKPVDLSALMKLLETGRQAFPN